MADLPSWLSEAGTFLQALLANGIVVAVLAWIAKQWADKRIEKIKGAQAQQLEKVKGEQSREIESLKGEIANLNRQFQVGLEKKMMVFKTHFELEFQAYRDVWALCDEAYNIAWQTLGLYQRSPINKKAFEEERVDSIKRYDTVRLALDEVRKKRPFIAKDIADCARTMLAKCVEITNTYKTVYPAMNDEKEPFNRKPYISDLRGELKDVGTQYDELAELISTRISRMYVADFGDGS